MDCILTLTPHKYHYTFYWCKIVYSEYIYMVNNIIINLKILFLINTHNKQ